MKLSAPVRYAVVGLGHISQAAVLPAFGHAARNSHLSAVVSGDPLKRKKLGKKYGVPGCSYDEYESLLSSGEIDAVYIALPNSLHAEYAVRAARQRIHVLCEKPMAVTEDECQQMIHAAQENKVCLMVAYRLHFEEANLKAVEIARSGKLGDLRAFESFFSMQVKAGDIRLQRELGGGTLYDIGIYCINAARYLFQAEPEEVTATTANKGDGRFREVDEMTSAVLRFPGERLAVFTCSFGAFDQSRYEIIGTKGSLRVEPAYGYVNELAHELKIGEKVTRKTFAPRDQFASELLYFSDCVLQNDYPEPSGTEGLADVRVVRALYRSAETGQPVRLGDFARSKRPSLAQEIRRPPVRKEPELVHAESPKAPK
ncbi:MAG TPA: Gfo/Idh/MocA family oxidoreductase [Candidatus Eisenbacteria bacterium]|nr:Gfo/Idh/MocA family oxidoreductase [Candidatus Eisenbacteria bacterium]